MSHLCLVLDHGCYRFKRCCLAFGLTRLLAHRKLFKVCVKPCWLDELDRLSRRTSAWSVTSFPHTLALITCASGTIILWRNQLLHFKVTPFPLIIIIIINIIIIASDIFWVLHKIVIRLCSFYILVLLRIKCIQERRKKYIITGQDRPLGLQEVEAPRMSKKLVHEGGNVVSPTYRTTLPPPPQEISLVLISVRRWVDSKAVVRPEGLSRWKVSMSHIGN
jgi:hypothetical protein